MKDSRKQQVSSAIQAELASAISALLRSEQHNYPAHTAACLTACSNHAMRAKALIEKLQHSQATSSN